MGFAPWMQVGLDAEPGTAPLLPPEPLQTRFAPSIPKAFIPQPICCVNPHSLLPLLVRGCSP